MSDLDPESSGVLFGILYAAVGFLIVWLAKILGFFGVKQGERLKAVEEKQTATDSRINVLEATVVKDKEMRLALTSLRKDVDHKLEAMNGSILGATDKFLTEHHQTRSEVKDDISAYKDAMKEENKELVKVLTALYTKERKS